MSGWNGCDLKERRHWLPAAAAASAATCVARLVAKGAQVAFVYQSNREAAEHLIAELQAGPDRVRALQANVRDLARASNRRSILRRVEAPRRARELGRHRRGRPVGRMAQEQWRSVVETNLGGTFNYCHAVTQPMMMQRGGSIVNLSSTAAEFASRGQVNYAASKGGIDGLTRAAAKELSARNIRVNAVAPGMIETDMSQLVRTARPESRSKKSSP